LSRKKFLNELERARWRPDADLLIEVLGEYWDWHDTLRRKDSGEAVDDTQMVIDPMLHDASDIDRSLALVVLAMATYDDAFFLGLVAAGPLEDILSTHNPDILARIVDEARKTPRFRWMLSGVWLHAIEPTNVDAISEAVGTMSMDADPLPERPGT
jgi:hypothetical protein